MSRYHRVSVERDYTQKTNRPPPHKLVLRILKLNRVLSLRIALFIPALCGGGAQKVLVDLANHWSSLNYDVTVITLSPADRDRYALYPDVKRLCLGVESASKNRIDGLIKNLRRVRRLRKVLISSKYSIAISFTIKANIILGLAALGTPTTSIATEHSHPPNRGSWGLIWEGLRRVFYRFPDAIIAPTHGTSDWIQQKTHSQRTFTVPNPITKPQPNYSSGRPTDDRPHHNRPILLSVGRLHSIKRFDLLINVFSSLALRHAQWDLVIVGEGSERDRLESLIGYHNLEGRVYLPGWTNDIGWYYANAIVFVLSSGSEAFGNVIVEAMASGLPVVSTDCPVGPRAIITHKVDGLLVPSDSPDALESAIERLMEDTEFSNKLVTNARQVQQRYSLHAVTKEWEQIFQVLGVACSDEFVATCLPPREP